MQYSIAYHHIHTQEPVDKVGLLAHLAKIAETDHNGACVDIVEVPRTCRCKKLYVAEKTILIVIQHYSPV